MAAITIYNNELGGCKTQFEKMCFGLPVDGDVDTTGSVLFDLADVFVLSLVRSQFPVRVHLFVGRFSLGHLFPVQKRKVTICVFAIVRGLFEWLRAPSQSQKGNFFMKTKHKK